MNISDFARRYFTELFNSEDLTLAELRDVLNHEDVQPWLDDVRLSDLASNENDTPRTSRILDRCVEIMQETPADWWKAEELAELADSNANYVSRLLRGGIEKNEIPVVVRFEQLHERGRPTPLYQYSAAMADFLKGE